VLTIVIHCFNACSLRLGCWRRKPTRVRSGAYSGTDGVAERPGQAPNGSAARRRDYFSRDERAWREAERAAAKSAQAPSLTGTGVRHGGLRRRRVVARSSPLRFPRPVARSVGGRASRQGAVMYSGTSPRAAHERNGSATRAAVAACSRHCGLQDAARPKRLVDLCPCDGAQMDLDAAHPRRARRVRLAGAPAGRSPAQIEKSFRRSAVHERSKKVWFTRSFVRADTALALKVNVAIGLGLSRMNHPLLRR